MAKASAIWNSVKRVLIVVGLVAFFAGGWLACTAWNNATGTKVTLDTATVTEQLESCQDLVTAKLNYRGLVTYEEGEIAYLTKTGFTMIYDAEVQAGIDLSAAEVEVSGKSIQITLPAATITSVAVDADSLEFYDEQYALFNWQEREDTAAALALAEADAQATAEESGLVEAANEQAVEVIETLLAPVTSGDDGYTLTVTVAE